MSKKPTAPRASLTRLANELSAARLDGSAVAKIVRSAGIRGAKGATPILPAVNAICAYLRKLADDAESDAAKDRARKLKSEANTAEINEARQIDELMPKSSIRPIWTDAVVQVRQMIESAEFLSLEQRNKLIAALAKITLDEPEENSPYREK